MATVSEQTTTVPAGQPAAEEQSSPSPAAGERVRAVEHPAVAEERDRPAAERGANRSHRPTSRAFRAFIAQGWQERAGALPPLSPAAGYAAARRGRLGRLFPGDCLVVPAGALATRSNDTDFRFRPHSAFAHLTGLGTDREPDAVLVLHPEPAGTQAGGPGPADTHRAVLYFRPRAERDSEEFYADARYGELWVGVRPGLEELAAETGLATAHIHTLPGTLRAAGTARLRAVTGADPAVDALVAQVRTEEAARRGGSTGPGGEAPADDGDGALVEALAELRLVKDEYEIGELRRAVAATVDGFAEIVRALPRAVAHARGERVLEGAFGARAREDGNGVGYETIAAAGDHACTLHWIRNDGPVRPGRLVLVDAGVEVESLYTADITRTLPVDGAFSPVQRRVYEAVLAAADAAFAAVRPGIHFRDVHAAAMAVIAARLEAWGLLPATAEESLGPEGQYHRRWMVHGTSHHLGLDVHDCAQARRELYLDGVLEPGMVFTIEPGLYFKAEDLAVPAEYRGIGVRIEDDVLVTSDGAENLSAALPRRPDDVEAWMRALLP
jgi:Xaa-Pro aminopeptidase